MSLNIKGFSAVVPGVTVNDSQAPATPAAPGTPLQLAPRDNFKPGAAASFTSLNDLGDAMSDFRDASKRFADARHALKEYEDMHPAGAGDPAERMRLVNELQRAAADYQRTEQVLLGQLTPAAPRF